MSIMIHDIHHSFVCINSFIFLATTVIIGCVTALQNFNEGLRH